MGKYDVLVQVIDRLRAEAPAAYASYHPDASDTEAVNSARAKGFIHLFLTGCGKSSLQEASSVYFRVLKESFRPPEPL
jgi:hypothetical protein